MKKAIRRWVAKRFGLLRPECVWLTYTVDGQIMSYTTLEQAQALAALECGAYTVTFGKARVIFSVMDR